MFPAFVAGPGSAAAQHVRLHRCPRPRPAWSSGACGPTASATRSSTSRTTTCRSPRFHAGDVERFYAGVEVRREMGRDETFYSNDKARDLLGYRPQHSWRDVLPDPRREA